jgi:hypothetical protein
VQAGQVKRAAGCERVDVGSDAHPWQSRAQEFSTSSRSASALSSLVFSARASSLTSI